MRRLLNDTQEPPGITRGAPVLRGVLTLNRHACKVVLMTITICELIDGRYLDLVNGGMGFLPREHAIMDHPLVAKLWRDDRPNLLPREMRTESTVDSCGKELGDHCPRCGDCECPITTGVLHLNSDCPGRRERHRILYPFSRG